MNLVALARRLWNGRSEDGVSRLLRKSRATVLPISYLDLPVRVVNLLSGANIRTVAELASLRVSDLRKVKGLGDVYCALIERVMVEKGLWR